MGRVGLDASLEAVLFCSHARAHTHTHTHTHTHGYGWLLSLSPFPPRHRQRLSSIVRTLTLNTSRRRVAADERTQGECSRTYAGRWWCIALAGGVAPLAASSAPTNPSAFLVSRQWVLRVSAQLVQSMRTAVLAEGAGESCGTMGAASVLEGKVHVSSHFYLMRVSAFSSPCHNNGAI